MATPAKTPARKAAAKKNGNGAAPRKVTRAEAQKAIAEMKDKDKPKVADFRGVKAEVPPVLQADFLFDVGELQSGDGTDFSAVHRLMVSFLGEAQWRKWRDKIREDRVPLEEAGDLMEEVFAAITEPYGVSMGESEASATT